jgi:hypothetical protein
MRQVECEFEAEVLVAVLQSRWPERVDTALREHTAACAICQDVAAVAGAFESASEAPGFAIVSGALPDSGRVWWKAQLRARREALEMAARPINAIQVVAFACAMALMGACLGATSAWFQAAVKGLWMDVTGANLKSFVPYAAGLILGHWILAACMATLVFVMPVAVYLAIRKD